MVNMTNFRWKVAWLIFILSFVSYMDRVNLSVATPVIMKEYGFDKVDMGLIQTFFFAGYALMQVPGGMMAEKFGHRITGTLAVIWWSVFTVLTACAKGKLSFAAIRFLFGMGEGPVYPAFGIAIYRWFNVKEKGNASSFLLTGSFLGPVIGPAATVALLSLFGWHMVFILFGLVGFVMAYFWYKYVPENPADSPYVNKEELAFIQEGRATTDTKKEVAPWGRLFRSTQFWAIGVQYFITDYVMFVFLSWLPLYLMEAHGFSLAKMGMWAALPWLTLIIVTFGAGYVCDKAIAAGGSQYWIRTLSGAAGIVLCSVSLYMATLTANPMWNVMWLSLSLGSLGLTFNASWACAINLGGKFAGSVSGWMNFWGNIGGVIAPTLTAWIATAYSWDAALLATAFSGIIGVVAWIFVKPDKPIV